MKLAAMTDLDAPIGFVYECIADHQSWEREAVERGIDLERPADMPLSGLGAGWLLKLPFRGRLVNLLLRLVHMVRDDRIDFDLQSNAIEGDLSLSVMALSPRRTRLRLQIEVKPRTLTARVLLNTLKLAKGRVQARMDLRVHQMGAQILARYADRRR
ncbi:MAG: hypothetical protein JNK34_09825 [Tabrizicola sp.]|nr:hypothetical protein [Tabrizicola sp.]